MAALGDVSREVKQPPTVPALALGSSSPGPTVPTYGQIFPLGR